MKFKQPALLLFIAGVVHCANAHAYTFDASMLGDAAKGVDMSLFNQGVQQPGTYRVDVMVNGKRVDTRDVVFKLEKDGQGTPFLAPCLTVSQLSRYGVKTEDYPQLWKAAKTPDECADLSAIPQAKAVLDINNQQLQLSIPQLALRPEFKGIAPEDLWDDGIPAFLMNYSARTTQTDYKMDMERRDNSSWVQLQPGINMGAWRVRNATSWQRSSQQSGKWQAAYTYAERGLYSLKSRLTLGQKTSQGEIFDSVPFTGVMLASDDNMVPYSERQFAPVVRGIARTQARVEVKQNGYTIYNTTVAPGPFALRDLSVTDSSGDLHVTVWEADGSTQMFVVPYQTPAIALHQGYLKYSLLAGRYRSSDSATDKAQIAQATLMYGLPWNLTAYGGIQSATHYQAALLGLGGSLGRWGSLSVDGSDTHSQRQGEAVQQGASWRLRYSNQLTATGTNFFLTRWQYASQGYNTLSDVLDSYRHDGNRLWSWRENLQPSSRTTLMLSQSWGRHLGNLSLTGSRTDWRNRPGHDDSYGLSWGTSIGGGSLSLNWNQNRTLWRNGAHRKENITSLWFSMPLSRWTGNNVSASWQMTSPSHGGQTQQVGVNGEAFSQQLDWEVRQSYRADAPPGGGNNSALHLAWNGAYGLLGGDYSYSRAMRQMGVNIAGGIVIHHHGVTLGQPLQGSVALVEAPGASGVPVGGWPGVKTDFRGDTTVGNLNVYQENTVSLDPSRLPDDAEVTQTDVRVVPTEGAVVEAKFHTRIGARALMTLKREDGSAIPFGAQVTVNGQDGSAALVDTDSQVYLTGLADKGELTVKWGAQQCRVNYHLPAHKGIAGLYQMSGLCR
ncbi:fimbrial biogenesis outer membrane usher protein [Salmonella enterica subsp. enterica serovar Middlesbrough]|nr:fimbrial biogenesis outer membrane usher protein [Salmonella enterica subsp. enterica serovar Middlesbrough]